MQDKIRKCWISGSKWFNFLFWILKHKFCGSEKFSCGMENILACAWMFKNVLRCIRMCAWKCLKVIENAKFCCKLFFLIHLSFNKARYSTLLNLRTNSFNFHTLSFPLNLKATCCACKLFLLNFPVAKKALISKAFACRTF